jgi:hypothetical protein
MEYITRKLLAHHVKLARIDPMSLVLSPRNKQIKNRELHDTNTRMRAVTKMIILQNSLLVRSHYDAHPSAIGGLG